MSNRDIAPEYRPAWTNGAKAYPQVDTLNGIALAMYRKRNVFLAQVETGTVLHNTQKCSVCGRALNVAAPGIERVESARVLLDPKNKSASFRHYVCGWSALLQKIATIKVG